MLIRSLVELHAVFISMFFPSWKTVFKLSRHLLDTSSTPGYLLSFQTFSYRNLNRSSTTRWIDQESSWPFDSFSIVGGSIELLFCVFASFLDTSSAAASVDVVFLDTFLDRCLDTSRQLYLSRITEALYIGLSWSILISSISLDLSAPVHLPNHTLSLQTSFPSVFQAFSRISLHFVSFDSLFFMHFILWNLSFWDYCKIWGFSKSKRFCAIFGMGFEDSLLKTSCIAFHVLYNCIFMHLVVCYTCWTTCVLVGLDWAEPIMQFLLHITCSCIPHAYMLSFQYTCYIWTV